jgi:hypothetical protein
MGACGLQVFSDSPQDLGEHAFFVRASVFEGVDPLVQFFDESGGFGHASGLVVRVERCTSIAHLAANYRIGVMLLGRL